MMNCTEFKIWVESAKENDFIHPGAEIEQHYNNCEKCNREYAGLFRAYTFMDAQRSAKLPEFNSKLILNKLEEQSISKRLLKTRPIWLISRIAAVVIISAGIVAGIIAGNILNNNSSSKENPWRTEFSSLNGEQDYYSYLFD